MGERRVKRSGSDGKPLNGPLIRACYEHANTLFGNDTESKKTTSNPEKNFASVHVPDDVMHGAAENEKIFESALLTNLPNLIDTIVRVHG